MKTLPGAARSMLRYLRVCFKWLVLAVLVGCLTGPLGAAFGLALDWANETRGLHSWLLYLLPLGGLVIVFLYRHFDPNGGGSTNQVFAAVRERRVLTLRTAPLIFSRRLPPTCWAVPAAGKVPRCCWAARFPGSSAVCFGWTAMTAA